MNQEKIGARRSRWVIRAMEWDDSRARYPNIWHEGMPRHLIVFDRVAERLSLGDLLATYYPVSQRHAERSEKIVGISRVIGLRRSDRAGFAWVDLETAHRFKRPLTLDRAPRRVFLCCDPGWSDPEVELFRKVFDAAVAAGWRPAAEEMESAPAPKVPAKQISTPGKPEPTDSTATEASKTGPGKTEPGKTEPDKTGSQVTEFEPSPTESTESDTAASEAPVVAAAEVEPAAETSRAAPRGPTFAGADYGGDMRDPRNGTWLAILELADERLRIHRLEPTGRSGLQSRLRDPDSSLMRVEAIGLGFPFGLPLPFAESLIGGAFPDEGWWALVRHLERLSRPDYLSTSEEFSRTHGETKRLTDERIGSHSPLHRAERDLGPMTYHGIRMIGEDRSRYAIRPFESAQGKLLIEVCPEAAFRQLKLPPTGGAKPVVERLASLEQMPIDIDSPHLAACGRNRGAIDALLAARCVAVAVANGEIDKTPESLAPDQAERVRREGWIYGLEA